MDHTVQGILQARTLEWVAVLFSRGSSEPRKSNQGLLHCRRILYQLSYEGSLYLIWGKLEGLGSISNFLFEILYDFHMSLQTSGWASVKKKNGEN